MCFDILFRQKTDLNNNLYIRKMNCYILISENFVKPYGIYDDLKLAKEEYNNLTKRYINASLYIVETNTNITQSKSFYTLLYDNDIHTL